MTLLGLLAGACTTVSFLPQVVRTFRTESAADISWGWLALFGGGVVGWLTYGLLTDDVAIAVSNAVTLALVAALAALKAAWASSRVTVGRRGR
jgi:MtN3 and saliva related transmembrane protein